MPAITATASLARRIDGAELSLVRGMAEITRADGAADVQVWPVGETAAVLADRGSPFNKLIGLGFDGPVDEATLEMIEREHDRRDAPLQVELATLADPAVAAMLTRRGYHLVGFENVLARRPEPGDAGSSGAVSIGTCGEAEHPRWVETLTAGFLQPDVFDGPASHESFDADVLARNFRRFGRLPGVVQMLARLDQRIAGGASLFVHDGMAILCGAATLPDARRRGVQSALLRARLSLARERGCELAVVTTQPGSPSQANVQRAGFQLIYSRAILVRPPAPGQG